MPGGFGEFDIYQVTVNGTYGNFKSRERKSIPFT
jgi:hypothetical protein